MTKKSTNKKQRETAQDQTNTIRMGPTKNRDCEKITAFLFKNAANSRARRRREGKKEKAGLRLKKALSRRHLGTKWREHVRKLDYPWSVQVKSTMHASNKTKQIAQNEKKSDGTGTKKKGPLFQRQ